MDEITQVGMQFVTEDIQEELKGNASFLMNSAINFIKELEKIVYEYQHIQGAMRLGTESLSRLRAAMQFSQNKLQDIIKAQYTFEKQVNDFLGRQIHFAWVDVETGETFFVKQTSAEQIYVLLSEVDNGSRGKIKADRTVAEQEAFKRLLQSLPSFIREEYENRVNERISHHQALFQEVMTRLNNNNDRTNPWSREHSGTVYWRHPPMGATNNDIWAWSARKQKGIIAQGYLNLIFNSTEVLTDSHFDIGHFMMDYVGPNDRIPGIVKGDLVIRNTDNKVQVAVKSNTLFSTASVGPYIAVAYKIINFYDNISDLTEQKVELILKGMEDYRQHTFSRAQEQAETKLNRLFEQSKLRIE